MKERELDLQADVRSGYEADLLMKKMAPYLDTVEEGLLEWFQAASVSDEKGIMGIKLQLHALKSLKANISTVIDTGRLAAAELRNNGDE